MAEPPKSSRRSTAPTTPTDYPTTPVNPTLSGLDHSFLLQSMYEIRGSIGELTQAVKILHEQSNKHDVKIDNIGKDVHAAKAVAKSMGMLIAFIGALITIAIAIIGYIAIPVLFKLLDVGSEILRKTH